MVFWRRRRKIPTLVLGHHVWVVRGHPSVICCRKWQNVYFCFIPLNSGSPLWLEPVGRIYSYAARVIGESLGGPLSTASADSALRTLVVQTMRKGGRDKPQRICKLTNTLQGGGGVSFFFCGSVQIVIQANIYIWLRQSASSADWYDNGKEMIVGRPTVVEKEIL